MNKLFFSFIAFCTIFYASFSFAWPWSSPERKKLSSYSEMATIINNQVDANCSNPSDGIKQVGLVDNGSNPVEDFTNPLVLRKTCSPQELRKIVNDVCEKYMVVIEENYSYLEEVSPHHYVTKSAKRENGSYIPVPYIRDPYYIDDRLQHSDNLIQMLSPKYFNCASS